MTPSAGQRARARRRLLLHRSLLVVTRRTEGGDDPRAGTVRHEALDERVDRDGEDRD